MSRSTRLEPSWKLEPLELGSSGRSRGSCGTCSVNAARLHAWTPGPTTGSGVSGPHLWAFGSLEGRLPKRAWSVLVCLARPVLHFPPSPFLLWPSCWLAPLRHLHHVCTMPTEHEGIVSIAPRGSSPSAKVVSCFHYAMKRTLDLWQTPLPLQISSTSAAHALAHVSQRYRSRRHRDGLTCPADRRQLTNHRGLKIVKILVHCRTRASIFPVARRSEAPASGQSHS